MPPSPPATLELNTIIELHLLEYTGENSQALLQRDEK